MTKKEKETLTKEIKELQEWMKDSCGENVQEDELPQIIEDCGDIYEVIATIKLSSGDIFTIHNRCFDSFIRGHYCGDMIYVEGDVLFIEIWKTKETERLQFFRTPISNVQLLGMTSVDINWANLWNDYITKHPGFILPKRNDEYSNPVVEDLSAMVKEVGDRFGFRLQSAIQSPYPKGLPITSSIPMLNPQGSLYLNYGAQHGETVEHDFIKSLNNEKEKQ